MHRILVALDASPHSRGVLAAGLDLARRARAKVHLLRAVALPPELPSALWATADVTSSTLARARAELDAVARELPAELVDGTTVQVGAPWDAICEAARELDVDLIVVGAHGHGEWGRLLGTTASKVVNHADRTVFVVREPETR